VSSALADGGSKHFDIPAQNLQSALTEFARQADRQILFATDIVSVKRTDGVKGEFEPEAALRQLLKGSGLTYRVTADQTILAEIPKAKATRGNTNEAAQRSAVAQATAGGSPSTKRTALPRENGDAPPLQGLLEELLVTGTLIRGVAPAGTNVISMSSEEVASTGAVSASQMLSNVPQLGGFNNLDVLTENTQITVKRPNIRNLPGLGTSGGSTTLVLLDGHRLVGAGIRQTAPDPDVLPPSAIERVEVIPDGGSATYGADAVGGVINLITRRRFDGFEAGGRYGFADDYATYDLNATAGRDWGSGSVYASYNYATHDALLGRDRDYVRRYDANGGPAADLTCNPGNVSIQAGLSQTLYAIPRLAPNTSNLCDTSDHSAFYPKEFNTVFTAWSQDFGDSVKLDVRGFYSERRVENFAGPFVSSLTITPANPFYARTLDNPAPQPAATQIVSFDWSPVFGNASLVENTKLATWGVTPSISVDLGRSWQVRALTNVGRSTTTARNPSLNTALLDQASSGTVQTAINPYDIGATPNRQLLADIANFQFYGQGRQELVNHRVIADGGLLSLPGGEVRLAFGIEYVRESYEARRGSVVPGAENALAWNDADRNNESAFGELSIPIVGANNALSGVHSLVFSASARYDRYSDFGSTTNPKFAFTYEPLSWIAIRGNWGESFNAPSLADAAGSQGSVMVNPTLGLSSPLPGQYSPAQSAWPVVSLQGGADGIRPQTAETWSAGIELRPPALSGLVLNASYYHIAFDDLIGFPPVFNTLDFYTNYTPFYVLNPTRQQVEDAAAQIPGGPNAIAGLFDAGRPPVYVLIDARSRNLGNTSVGGLDFGVRYARDTGFGSIDASIFGTYELQRDNQPLPGLPWTDALVSDISRFRSMSAMGATVGKFRAQAQWNYLRGFTTTASSLQTHVGSFGVVNLFFSYDVANSGLLSDLQLTLHVGNVFDEDPPRFRGTYALASDGYANGSTVGRLIQFGVNKEF
jgi:iron complex outermembrane receptor protein